MLIDSHAHIDSPRYIDDRAAMLARAYEAGVGAVLAIGIGENPAEMQQAPLAKLHEIFGADAVLYITIEQFGSKYQVLSSNTYVAVRAKLVDAKTGIEIWNGRAQAVYSGQSGLIEALVTQVINKLVDQAKN